MASLEQRGNHFRFVFHLDTRVLTPSTFVRRLFPTNHRHMCTPERWLWDNCVAPRFSIGVSQQSPEFGVTIEDQPPGRGTAVASGGADFTLGIRLWSFTKMQRGMTDKSDLVP